ncbi:transferase 2, rSAM/selenodomain-associated [Neorhodopirellula lusitana]|uniref:Transferase 2, rSAM/selenodomain-associated n=1 Tax=Neorhodopirellula lusitana TaxID=445327 RepID=A0ABY1QJS2_9BACT|nr:TIGR04283 family arsenosugar biosynthesis glycosyltransferase [Neorhodopirellula lusitana]SMP71500.1 transferase 2, rSAM/selenodomain-associated [Neorhodopirellula lusitana]
MRTLSIIIPTYNEAAKIESAIMDGLRQGAMEVIVSDGGSRDETRAIVERLQTQHPTVLLINQAHGRGRQLAAGARHASGDVLLFLHADNRLDANASEQLAARNWPTWGGFEQRIDARGLRYRLLEWGNTARVKWTSRVFGDQAMFVDRYAYQQVGGFDEVDLMEDVLLSKKLKRIERAAVLPGKVIVDARRWHARGVVRQTLRNWFIQVAFALGVSTQTLRRWYR